MFSDLVFKFMDEFFLQERDESFYASKNCQKERWSICQACEHFDELGGRMSGMWMLFAT